MYNPIKLAKKKTISINASVLGSGGGFGYSLEKDALLHDIGVEIDALPFFTDYIKEYHH